MVTVTVCAGREGRVTEVENEVESGARGAGCGVGRKKLGAVVGEFVMGRWGELFAREPPFFFC